MDFREKTGRVLKKIAMVLFIIGTVSALFSGIFILVTQGEVAGQISTGNTYIFRGILVVLLGIFASFICYTLIYGFGQLLENQQELLERPMRELNDEEMHDFPEDNRRPRPGPRPMGFGRPRPRPRPRPSDTDEETDNTDVK